MPRTVEDVGAGQPPGDKMRNRGWAAIVIRFVVAGVSTLLILTSPPVLRAQDETPPGTAVFDADALATQVVAELAAGMFAAVRAQFDPPMADQWSEAGLAKAWATYEARLGSFQSAGQPTGEPQGDRLVEHVPVQLANGAGEVRITFHRDGTIAGLAFLPAGDPVPE